MTLGWHVVEQARSGYGWVDVGRDPWPRFRTRRDASFHAATLNERRDRWTRYVVRRET